MENAAEALSSVITKLGDLLSGEYNLQKSVRREIVFLQAELHSMKGAVEMVCNIPADQVRIQNKTWARDLRDLSYDMEDSIDTFMMSGKGNESAKLPGMRKYIDQSMGLRTKAKLSQQTATKLRDIKTRVLEVHERRLRYNVNNGVDKPTTTTVVDPRLFAQFKEANELVGIDETRDELIKILTEENAVTAQQAGKIVSIVGFGGLGKTTLAKAVYEKISAQFDCYAFVSVSQNPDMNKLFKAMLYQLDRNKYDDSINETFLDEQQLIHELREVLQHKRYFVVIDDLWDISVWNMIRYALPDNNVGYIIITTTRILTVARVVGGAYKLNPLSRDGSRKLFYSRIFGNENKDNIDDTECPYEELAEVSDRILKKCAGVPLAILTMASLLASKPLNKIDWYEVYHSIGTGLEHNLDVENMRKILSLSYYAMPSHLRICLLYLSMFPEGYKIEKDCLIWMWIAEDFIQCEIQGKSLFAIGESYFAELINRSMIQPIYDKYTGLIYACHVHDMMHDLICFLSSEENLVSILNDGYTSESKIFRRLSLQYGKEDNAVPLHTTSLQYVRSAIVFPSAFCVMPILTKFKVLHVLNLQGCDLSRGYSLEYLESLFHLRYLGLCDTHIAQLPEEIGNLEFLQTLDVRDNNMFSLPSTVVQLTRLMCLYIDEFTRVPSGIGSLTNLEVLSTLDITVSIDIIEELGQLMKLRVLHIFLFVGWSGKLVECLCNLQKIQDLYIKIFGDHQWDFGALDAWVAPQHLCRLDIEWPCWFSTLPTWMNQSYYLVYLSIAVRDLGQVNLETLGRLQALRVLKLSVDPKNHGTIGGFIIGAGLFRCLVFFQFGGSIGPIMFQQGAMPRLEILNFEFCVQAARQITCNGDGLELGLGNLSSLQDVKIYLRSRGASREEVKKLQAALKHAVEIHSNLPKHQICG